MTFLHTKQAAILLALTCLVGCNNTEKPQHKKSYITIIDGQLPHVNSNPLLNLNLKGKLDKLLLSNQDNVLLKANTLYNQQIIEVHTNGVVKTILKSDNLPKKEFKKLQYQEDALNSNNLVYISSPHNTIEAITPTNQLVLIAGKIESLTTTIENFINNKVPKNKSMPLRDAVFNMPIAIVESATNEWVVVDNLGYKLRKISKDHIISDLILNQNFRIKVIKSNKDSLLWLATDTSIFQYDVTQQKIIQEWKDQFKEVSDLSVSDLGVFIVDNLDSSVKKLNAQGQFETIYRAVCNDDYLLKNGDICNPVLDHYDDSLRFQPRSIVANPQKNQLLLADYQSVYTLSLTGNLQRLAGIPYVNINKTDYEIDENMQGCDALYTNKDGIYCGNEFGLYFYKNGQPPRELYANQTIKNFIIHNNALYSIDHSAINESPLTSHSENPKKIQQNNLWFGKVSDDEDEHDDLKSLITDEQGNIIFIDQEHYKIQQISPDKKITTLISFSGPENTSQIGINGDECPCTNYTKQPALITVRGTVGYVIDDYDNIYTVDLKTKSYKVTYKANKDALKFKSITIDHDNNLWLLNATNNHIYLLKNGQPIDLQKKLQTLGFQNNIPILSIAFSNTGDLLLGSDQALFKVDTTALLN